MNKDEEMFRYDIGIYRTDHPVDGVSICYTNLGNVDLATKCGEGHSSSSPSSPVINSRLDGLSSFVIRRTLLFCRTASILGARGFADPATFKTNTRQTQVSVQHFPERPRYIHQRWTSSKVGTPYSKIFVICAIKLKTCVPLTLSPQSQIISSTSSYHRHPHPPLRHPPRSATYNMTTSTLISLHLCSPSLAPPVAAMMAECRTSSPSLRWSSLRSYRLKCWTMSGEWSCGGSC